MGCWHPRKTIRNVIRKMSSVPEISKKEAARPFIVGTVVYTVVYYLCLLTYKYVGMAALLETKHHTYSSSMVMYAVFGGLGWCILGMIAFYFLGCRKLERGDTLYGIFHCFMFVVWMLFIGLVFMPPHNKWRKYNNYKDAIGTGVATLDCWKNGTSLKMPDPSTGINYVELAGPWHPNAETTRKKSEYGYKYQAHQLVYQGPLKCEFDQAVYAVCIEKTSKPCFGTHYGFTMLRRASVMPYTDGWLLNKIPQYNKLTHWEWDVNPRQVAIDYVDLCEEEEKEFWIVASCIHFVLFLIALIVFLCLRKRSSANDNPEETAPDNSVV
eukprot:TRINITY_DN1808_c0_g2_i6.p1 TRINITY_DN1808_c0_g2~~TRINITY_DN1808_c0_g2_i6.p1  ORF type:complete len:325 (+),score=42.26 TRINITY_DN1808_c0_g2_i6:67-1041(+)